MRPVHQLWGLRKGLKSKSSCLNVGRSCAKTSCWGVWTPIEIPLGARLMFRGRHARRWRTVVEKLSTSISQPSYEC